jgi:hypothetical protein
MCRALYLGSDRPLSCIELKPFPTDCMLSPTWPWEAQRFHTAPLRPSEEAARSHFTYPHVFFAGSYEGCACGFNYGREYPQSETDAGHSTVARESVAELVRYVRANRVLEIYYCWMDDEAKDCQHRRTVNPETLGSPDFFFRDRELLTIDHDGRASS